MIIKFIKDTKFYKKGQVIRGDYKDVIKQIKLKNAVTSTQEEFDQYMLKLKKNHQEKMEKIKIVNKAIAPKSNKGCCDEPKKPKKKDCPECEEKKRKLQRK